MGPYDHELAAMTIRMRAGDDLRRIIAELNALADEQDRLSRRRARLADELLALGGVPDEVAVLDRFRGGSWPLQRQLQGDPGS